MTRCQGLAPKHNFRFKNPLYSLDASTIALCLSLFPWGYFRTTKGAIKLHVGLNHAGYLPDFLTITEGNVHDVKIGKLLNSPKGSIIVMDKGYNDYSWCKQLTDKQIFFVTRLKKKAKYRVVSRRTVLKSKGLICVKSLSSQVIRHQKKTLHNFVVLVIKMPLQASGTFF